MPELVAFLQHLGLPLKPGRFGRPIRGEAELEEAFGVARSDDPFTLSAGWMSVAQDRATWKQYVQKYTGVIS